MVTAEQLKQGGKDILQTLMETAMDEARKQELELGRKLTEAEARELAVMVERQFRTAMAIARLG